MGAEPGWVSFQAVAMETKKGFNLFQLLEFVFLPVYASLGDLSSHMHGNMHAQNYPAATGALPKSSSGSSQTQRDSKDPIHLQQVPEPVLQN